MNKSVLIVDDSTYMRSLIKETLESAGYDIVGEATNGESAIDKALELNPDLITLDNILPDMIGTDILRILKSKKTFKSKVIMISDVDQESIINEGIALGAEDYIVVPFTALQLIESVNNSFT